MEAEPEPANKNTEMAQSFCLGCEVLEMLVHADIKGFKGTVYRDGYN